MLLDLFQRTARIFFQAALAFFHFRHTAWLVYRFCLDLPRFCHAALLHTSADPGQLGRGELF